MKSSIIVSKYNRNLLWAFIQQIAIAIQKAKPFLEASPFVCNFFRLIHRLVIFRQRKYNKASNHTKDGYYMKRIFLVEDDAAIAKNLTLLLRSEGFTVTHAPTRRDALAALDTGQFDLALVDISLPDGNGFAVCTEIKAARDIPVIFLTASGDEASVVTGLNMGADDYITKPFRPRELLARIGAALRKSGRAGQDYAAGGLHVDTASGIVTKNGGEVFLSALEYRLLLIFLNNPKSILTRGRLLEELWDAAGEFVNDNTLTVYIKRLREKIEDDPANPQIILTVRGTGYRLGGGYASE